MLGNRSDVGGPSVPISAYTTASTGYLDRVVASKGWAHLTLHEVIPSGIATTNQITVADLTTASSVTAAYSNLPDLTGAKPTDGVQILGDGVTAVKCHLNCSHDFDAAEVFTIQAAMRVRWRWCGTGLTTDIV